MTEHLFVSELVQEAWFGFSKKLEVLRTEVDDSGYDLVLECGGVIRHVQLKSSRHNATTSRQTINIALASKPSGCVVWILRTEDRNRMRLTYRFFGGEPGQALPPMTCFKKGTRVKGRKRRERANARIVTKRQFRTVPTARQLLEELFGIS